MMYGVQPLVRTSKCKPIMIYVVVKVCHIAEVFESIGRPGLVAATTARDQTWEEADFSL